MSFAPISKDRLERAKGDFRAQLPDVNTIRWALDYGVLLDRYPDQAEELRAGAALGLLLGSDVFKDETLVGLLPRIEALLKTSPGRENYLRFVLKYLQPCAFDDCRAFFHERGEQEKVRLLDLAKPFLADGQRPPRWTDKSTACKDWMGNVVEQIERQVGGELAEHL